MRYLSFLLFASLAIAYNPYMDYVLCRFHQEREPLKAEGYCLKALERAPTPSLYMDVVRLEMQLKNQEKALKVAMEFKAKYPDLSEPYILLHSIHTARREQDSALKILEEGYLKNPQSREVMVFLAEEYLKRGEPVKAKSVLQNLAKVSPDNPLPYFMLARIALSEGKQEEAIDFLQKVSKGKPYLSCGLYNPWWYLRAEEEDPKAKELYEDILKQGPLATETPSRGWAIYTP
ncbi:MAG: tetratricopeptide repeat protein [Aquificaceae bacterium]